MSEGRRLFFALWPGEAIRDQVIDRVGAAVRAAGGRPVPASNLHVTLAFLGSVTQLDAVIQAAGSVSGQSCDLVLDTLRFKRRAGLLWLEAAAVPDELAALDGHLAATLAANGFAPDTRPFRPHMTLVRKARSPGRIPDVEPVAWPVCDFALVESLTRPEGAKYTVVNNWPLRR